MRFFLPILLIFCYTIVFIPPIQGQLHLPWEEVLGPPIKIKSIVNTNQGIFGVSDQDLFYWEPESEEWVRQVGPILTGYSHYTSVRFDGVELYVNVRKINYEPTPIFLSYKAIPFGLDWEEAAFICRSK